MTFLDISNLILFVFSFQFVVYGLQRFSDGSGIVTNFEFADNELKVTHMGDEIISIDAIHPHDLSGDNKTDFFLSITTRRNMLPWSVEVFLRNREARQAVYDIGENNGLSFPFVLGDVDGDGDDDLVRCQLGATGIDLVWIEKENTLLAEYLGLCDVLHFGELNGDDIVDILCVRSSTFYLLNFNSDGSLTQVFYQIYYWDVSSPVYFDADGDGLLDIVFIGIYTYSYKSDYLYWIKQLPNFRFAPYERLIPGDFRQLISIDINGDGKLDLFTTQRETILNGQQVVRRYRNSIWYDVVNQKLVPHNISHSGYYASSVSGTAADINGDGKTDIALYDYGFYTWYEQINTTSFIPHIVESPYLVSTSLFAFGTRQQNEARGLLFASIDTIYLDSYDNVTNSLRRQTLVSSLKDIRDICGIDVNGDGLDDIVVTSGGNFPIWFEQQPNTQTFIRRQVSLFYGKGGRIDYSPTVNLWGISYYYTYGVSSTFLMRYDEFLAISNSKIIDDDISNQTTHLALVDIDEDGDEDLFVIIGNQLHWYQNNFTIFTLQGMRVAMSAKDMMSNHLLTMRIHHSVVTMMRDSSTTSNNSWLGWSHTFDHFTSQVISRPVCPWENISSIISAQVRLQSPLEDILFHLRDHSGVEFLVICDPNANLTSVAIHPIDGTLSSFSLCDLDGDHLLDVVTMTITITNKNPIRYSVHWYQQLEGSVFYKHGRMIASGDTTDDNLPLLSCADVDGNKRSDIILALNSIAWMKLGQKCYKGTRYDPKENTCVDCPNKQYCPNGATCSAHRRGRGCDLCVKGYFDFNGVCSKCSDVSVGASFSIGLFGTVALIFLASAGANTYMEQEGRQHLLSIAGITITHFQTLGLFFSYDFHIPFTFLKINSWFESLFTLMFFRFIFSPECHDGWNFYERWSFNVFAPFMFIIIQFILAIILSCFSEQIMKSLQPDKISIFIMIFTFIYTLQSIWEMWDCVHRGDGTYGLESHVNIQCFRNGKWAGFATLAFFLTFFYFGFILLSLSNANAEMIVFITKKYKKEHKNWEFFVELPKKAIFVFIETFSFGQVGQFVMSLLALLIFWYLHAKALPFQDDFPSHHYPNLENDYQHVAYLLQLFTLILLLIFGGNQNNRTEEDDNVSATIAFSISYFLSILATLVFSYHRIKGRIPKIAPKP